MNNRYLLIFIAIILSAGFGGCHNASSKLPANDADVIHLLNTRLTDVIMQDGFSPPVASRIYAYSSVAAYEAAALGKPGYKSLNGQLNGLNDLPEPAATEGIDNRIAFISAFVQVANSIVYRDSILQNLGDSLINLYAASVNEKVKTASLEYADRLAGKIIAWSNKDGYGATRKMAIYNPPVGLQYWQPTPPKYTDAIEPYWYLHRTFVIDSASQYAVPFDIPFDTIPGTPFYNMVKEVYDNVKGLDSVKYMKARFWDDNPMIALSKGHTMLAYRQITPGGHWMSIARIACVNKNVNLLQACDVYLRVSLSLADAFIASWKLKYSSNLIRPITYINQYIDPAWKPVIETPPFPEYTCGHSTISAAASQALADFFGDKMDFVDNTNDPYNLPIRTFHSFLDASEEAGLSRMYGGVHYHHSCLVGRNQGLQIAQYITKEVSTGPALQ